MLPLLDADRARAVAANDVDPGDADRGLIEQALTLNTWLERYDVRLVA